MKKFNLGLFAILMAIALGLTTDKPTGANSPRLSTCSLDSLYAPSTLPLRAAPRLIADDSMRNQGLVESYNWSGYAVPTTTAGSVTYAAGSWTVPAVTGSAGQYSAIWVGLDGFDDGTVEQLGTMQYLTSVRSGRSTTTQAQYCAWVEMYPAAMVELTGTVQPGDSITASVTYTPATTSSSAYFTLNLADVTENWKYAHTFASSSRDEEESAEWIVEAPSSGGILPLADFGAVTFTDCLATISGTTAPISGFAWDSITMVEDNRKLTPEAVPTALVPGVGGVAGDGFSVNWEAP